MTVKAYRAVPLARLGRIRAEVTVSADCPAAALELAKAELGEGVAFDLCDGMAVVLSHLPAREWRSVGKDEGLS